MTFVPPSSIPSGSVTIVGPVAVTGPQTDAEFAARLPFGVTGPLTSAQLLALEPLGVTVGNFPAVQTVDVDNFPATQPVSVDSLPLPDGAATEDTLAAVNGAANDGALTAILERDRMATE